MGRGMLVFSLVFLLLPVLLLLGVWLGGLGLGTAILAVTLLMLGLAIGVPMLDVRA